MKKPARILASAAFLAAAASPVFAQDAAPVFNEAQCLKTEPVQERSFTELMSVMLQLSTMTTQKLDIEFVFESPTQSARVATIDDLNTKLEPEEAANIILQAPLTYMAMKDSGDAKEYNDFMMASPDKMCSISKETYQAAKSAAVPVVGPR